MIRIIKVFICLIAFYTLSLMMVYSIPDFSSAKNVKNAQLTYDVEGAYPVLNKAYSSQTKLDNFTDLKVMMIRAHQGKGVIDASMDMTGYARYWHGYQIILKPLISFFSYEKIRFIYSTILLLLVATCSALMWKRVSSALSLSFIVSLCFIHYEIIGMSIQFSNVFIITFLSMIYILLCNDKYDLKGRNNILLFFIIGSIVNYIDLLTVPLVSLGMPLVLIIMLSNGGLRDDIVLIIKSSISWVLGYGLTWISKWAIATFLLGKNVFYDAIDKIFFRTMGDQLHPIKRLDTIALNFEAVFPHVLIPLSITLFILITLIIKRELFNGKLIPLLILAVMPYAWYIALANHSQIHYWFTFRAQIITVFVILTLFTSSLRDALKNSKFID
ncbi:hypothetical protein I3A27_14655 [Escherichia coli]|uniref:hypothetical protein n=1 Tax=Escherichia TaxID=561 RepID=UPI000DA5DF48|nr:MULTISPECIES: hypothetical protein [Escherichia]EFC3930503.1 hypothetical protein [Escherichia coli]EFH9020437.1 hypothetical protein [Escherichia coli]EFN5033590.1 hypothetical protein [Escherichia coli]EFV3272794.1 hypothetical protein [Escherichia coli]EJG2764042.1 hypothetical protein [Escherichia coli]